MVSGSAAGRFFSLPLLPFHKYPFKKVFSFIYWEDQERERAPIFCFTSQMSLKVGLAEVCHQLKINVSHIFGRNPLLEIAPAAL